MNETQTQTLLADSKISVRLNSYKSEETALLSVSEALAAIQARLNSSTPNEGLFALVEDVLFPMSQLTWRGRMEHFVGAPALVVRGGRLSQSILDRIELLNGYVETANENAASRGAL